MRRIACLVVLCVAGAGCRVCDNAWRTLIEEPSQYSEDADRHGSRARCRRLAEDAWAERYWSCPDGLFSQDYADGFLHGFTEYLLAGGTALPPPLPLPPRKYWRDEYATPSGQQAASDWLAGAYDGIRTAQESGYREWMTVPASASSAAGAPPPVIVSPPGIPVESAAPVDPAPAAVGPVVPPPPAAIQDPPRIEPEETQPPAADESAPGAEESNRQTEAADPPFEASVPDRLLSRPSWGNLSARQTSISGPTTLSVSTTTLSVSTPTLPDSAPTLPDSAPTLPTLPDLATTLPDLATTPPDSATKLPDLAPALPTLRDLATTLPELATTLPDSTTTLPDSTTTLPTSAITLPASATTLPDSATALPDSATIPPASATTRARSTTTLSASATTRVVRPAHLRGPAPSRPIAHRAGATEPGDRGVTDGLAPPSIAAGGTAPDGDQPADAGPALPHYDPGEESTEASPE
jgi:hypothetical protein